MSGVPKTPALPRADVVRVLVVHDHPIFRCGLVALLDHDPRIRVVGDAGEPAEAVTIARRLAPDLVLIDLDGPGHGAIAAVEAVTTAAPATHVLVFTDSAPDEELAAMIRAGASGFLSHRSDAMQLGRAVRRAAGGETVLPAAMTTRLLRAAGHGNDGPVAGEPLSARENDVLLELADGLTNDEIADRLCISPATVRTHVSHILGKLGLRRRIQAALYAFRHGIARSTVEPPTP